MKLSEVLRLTVLVETPITTGPTTAGESRVIAFRGGRFEGAVAPNGPNEAFSDPGTGPRLRGSVLQGGTDWQRIRPGGTLEIRARYMLQTEEGENIEVISEGLRAASKDVLARLSAGEAVPPDQYYFRTFIRLNAAAERLAWMNDRLFIGVGARKADEVEITIYQVP